MPCHSTLPCTLACLLFIFDAPCLPTLPVVAYRMHALVLALSSPAHSSLSSHCFLCPGLPHRAYNAI